MHLQTYVKGAVDGQDMCEGEVDDEDLREGRGGWHRSMFLIRYLPDILGPAEPYVRVISLYGHSFF
jgi:hypothetical protein